MDDIKEIVKYTKELKLLYVEDNKDARESTYLILKDFFENITTAIDGEDGRDKFLLNNISNIDEPFDFIITDINMPKIDGLEMIKDIRRYKKDIPILVISSYSESDYFISSIKLDVEGYLLKPIVIKQFVGVLRKSIQKLKLSDEAKTNLHFLKQYQEATDHNSIVSKTNTNGIITYVNDDFCKISEYTKDELIGKNHNIVRHPDNTDSLFKNMWNTITKEKQVWKGLIRNRSKSGKNYYVKTTIKPILDPTNNIVEYIALRDDVTDIMNPKKQLEDLVDSSSDIVAVMFKIEHFEDIEKFYGQKIVHKIEDKFSTVLIEKMPKNCIFETIYPLGYGKYVFAKIVDDESINIDEIVQNLKEFQETVNHTKIEVENIDYHVNVVLSLSYGDNVLENINYGMKELQETKQDFLIANNLVKIEHEKAQKNIETITLIKKAIDEFKVISYFQPIINNQTLAIDKYESLVRIIDQNNKILIPIQFLDIAKKGKYYTQITNIVLENSFDALYKTTKDISINLSALDIEQRTTRDKIFELINKNSKECSRIVFELLEDESVKNFNTIKIFINHVKKMGVKIAIDDFGAGYSNFERLVEFSPDILKIDGCLIRDIQTDNYSLSVVKSIVAFAKEQNIKIIAEYVENKDIFDMLNMLGVDYSQGYYFGKPQPLEKEMF